MAIAEHQIEVGKLSWFYREAEPLGTAERLPVLLLHGLVAQSYSWRGVMPALAEQGFRAIAPDWIGHGFSSKPDRRDFAYTSETFLTALGDFIAALELERFHLVAQGFLGSVGVQYALRHPEQVERLVMVNLPLSPQAKLPFKIQQFSWPFVGDMVTQDPLLVDRTLEGGGPYQVDDADLDVYRRPFLKSSDAGRALLATVRGLNLAQATTEIAQGLSEWPHPTLVIWGLSDPWLPLALAEECMKTLSDGELAKLDQVGHYGQEDWAEKVVEVLSPFLRRMAT
jgi:pimeloyl-ACP methyl ester carboxylesterase